MAFSLDNDDASKLRIAELVKRIDSMRIKDVKALARATPSTVGELDDLVAHCFDQLSANANTYFAQRVRMLDPQFKLQMFNAYDSRITNAGLDKDSLGVHDKCSENHLTRCNKQGMLKERLRMKLAARTAAATTAATATATTAATAAAK
jgi:hypothetical protein